MLKGLGRKIKNILFPPFSELELVTFSYLLFILFIEAVLNYPEIFKETLLALVDIVTSLQDIPALFGLVAVLIFVIYLIQSIIKHALYKESMMSEEKAIFSYWFYLLTSAIMLYLSIPILFEEKEGLFEIINRVNAFLIITRSGFAFVTTLLLHKLRKTDILASQMLDAQISRDELFLLLFLGPLTYIVLRMSYSSLSSVALAYFYTTTLILFYRETMKAV
ncbi:hypothetical protein ISS85_01840 [Candidatus Microgenomates bacterium]|nr:hypothetical protein [Candidatus Microgenomates bacterium]